MVHLAAILIAVLITFVASPSTGHEGQHVMGTVTGISTSQLEVKTTKGETVSVQFTDKTQFHSKDNPASNGRPKVGDRVVIDVIKDGNSLKALGMEFASPVDKSKPTK
jgi:hypothetical protein